MFKSLIESLLPPGEMDNFINEMRGFMENAKVLSERVQRMEDVQNEILSRIIELQSQKESENAPGTNI